MAMNEAQTRLGEVLEVASRWLAYFGGLVLAMVALMTVASIIGRGFTFLGLSSILGDFELVEVGTGVAIFSFLPWCQLKRGHVTVDIVVDQLPETMRQLTVLLGNLVLLLVSGIMMWRFWLGFGEKFPYGSEAFRAFFAMGHKSAFPETTFILGMPVWWGFFLSLFGAFLFLLVCVYTVWVDITRITSSKVQKT